MRRRMMSGTRVHGDVVDSVRDDTDAVDIESRIRFAEGRMFRRVWSIAIICRIAA